MRITWSHTRATGISVQKIFCNCRSTSTHTDWKLGRVFNHWTNSFLTGERSWCQLTVSGFGQKEHFQQKLTTQILSKHVQYNLIRIKSEHQAVCLSGLDIYWRQQLYVNRAQVKSVYSIVPYLCAVQEILTLKRRRWSIKSLAWGQSGHLLCDPILSTTFSSDQSTKSCVRGLQILVGWGLQILVSFFT